MRLKLLFLLLALSVGAQAQVCNAALAGGSLKGSGSICGGGPVLQSITVSPPSSAVAQSTVIAYNATGNFSDGTTLDLTNALGVVWTNSDNTVASLGPSANPQLATCLSNGNGTTSISATFGSVQGTASLSCFPPPIITTNAVPSGTVSVPYTATVTACCGTLPYSWTLLSGSLPTGITLSSNSPSATIAGTTTTLGTFAFVLQVTDAAAHSGTKSFVLSIVGPIQQLSTLPQRAVNARECMGPYTNTIALPASGSGGSWSCHGNAKGPYGTMPSISAINAAIVDAEACRQTNGDSTLITAPVGMLDSQSIGTNGGINLKQTGNDSSTGCIALDTPNPLPTTDPLTAMPRDQELGTYNIASTNGLVRTSNVVTVSAMNTFAVVPVVGELAAIWLPDDKSFQGQYPVCGPPTAGCIAPTTTQFTYQQTGPDATTQNGEIEQLQKQNTIQQIVASGCDTTGVIGARCTLSVDFFADPGFRSTDCTGGDAEVLCRFEIINSTCTGCITLDPNAFNTTWYVATVTSNANCATCRITVFTYTEYFGNGAIASNGTALHFNHIFADQRNCCMFTIESTGGGGSFIFGDTNNFHHFYIADIEFRSKIGTTAGIAVGITFDPIGQTQTPRPAMSVAGCNGSPALPNCDEPIHNNLNHIWLHAYTFPFVGRTVNGMTVGIKLDCEYCGVTNSYLSDIHADGQESHGISIKAGGGPFKIVHNRLEGSSETFFAAYLPYVTGLSNGYYCDLEFRRNWVTANMFEVLNSGGNIPNSAGKYFQNLLKNRFEGKNSCNWLVAGNIFENSGGGVGEQQGTLIGNNGTPNNGTSTAPQLGSQMHDVQYEGNICRHAFELMYYPTRSPSTDSITFSTNNYTLLNNLCYDLGDITRFGRNSWGGTNWTISFSDFIQVANRGQQYAASGTQTTGIATLTLVPPATCVAPIGFTGCGSGLQNADWIAVVGCSDPLYNVVATQQVTVLSTDPTLSNQVVSYPVPSGAAATVTGCTVGNAYGHPRFTTVEKNTIVANYNFTNPTYNNVAFLKPQTIGCAGLQKGFTVGAEIMARDWWMDGNMFSSQVAPGTGSAHFIWSAPNSKEGTIAEQFCLDANSMKFINNGVAGFNGIPGYSPSLYTEYNAPGGVPGVNHGASPPVTDLMGLTNACSGSPDNTCMGFLGNYAIQNFGQLGGTNTSTNVPDFAPTGQGFDIFSLSPSSYFAAGHGGQNPDGTDNGVNLNLLYQRMTEQQYICTRSCGSGFFP